VTATPTCFELSQKLHGIDSLPYQDQIKIRSFYILVMIFKAWLRVRILVLDQMSGVGPVAPPPPQAMTTQIREYALEQAGFPHDLGLVHFLYVHPTEGMKSAKA
jgi:hypothetical protein